jgi:hypothetical protein
MDVGEGTAVDVQVLPPFVVDTKLPVPPEFAATQSLVSGHEMCLGFEPDNRFDEIEVHVEPPLVVSMACPFESSAKHVDDEGHEMSCTDGNPLGAPWLVQLTPPLVVALIRTLLLWSVPTTQQSLAFAHDTPHHP